MDLRVLLFIQENLRTLHLDKFFSIITSMNNLGIFWVFVGVILLFFKKHRKLGICMLVALLLTALLGEVVLKNMIGRLRPFVEHNFNLIIPPPGGYSFPSGHTASSFCSAFIIYRYDKRFGILAYILAFLIAFSRIYLLVHYPTDILGGIILGSIVGFLVSKYFFKEK